MKSCLPKALALFFVLILIGVGWKLYQNQGDAGQGRERNSEARPVPVEVTEVIIGPIEEKKTFSGTLEPSAETEVASRVGGRILDVAVDLADVVQRNDVVVRIDPAEYQQAVARAQADLSVSQARLREGENRLTIATRELQRIENLAERGISSASEVDTAKGEHLIRTSALEVARAEVSASEAALETANIRLEDTRVKATWKKGDNTRLVAHRRVEEGDTITANQALLHVVEIDPIQAVFFVPERDYARLHSGQEVLLTTDATRGVTFPGTIQRIAPVFEEQSRQARVEVFSSNSEALMKPGMFVRATVQLERHENARIVPEAALTRRGNSIGIFLVNPETKTAHWHEVTPGIRDGDRVEVQGEGIQGLVVSLGQQLLEDGSKVILPEPSE